MLETYDFSRKEPSKTTQLIYRKTLLKTLLVLYTFGIVVSVSSALTFFKKKTKEGQFYLSFQHIFLLFSYIRAIPAKYKRIEENVICRI